LLTWLAACAAQGLLLPVEISFTVVSTLYIAADETAAPDYSSNYALPLPPEAVYALHYALFGCAKACVQLAAAVAAAASSSQAWHLDFRIGWSEGFCGFAFST